MFCTNCSEGYVPGPNSHYPPPQGTPAAGTLGGTGGSVGSGTVTTPLTILMTITSHTIDLELLTLSTSTLIDITICITVITIKKSAKF